jgi:hypothetical protein
MLAHKELLAHKWMSNLRKPRGGARTLVDLEMLALFNGKAKLIRVECSTGRGDRIGRNTPETQAKNSNRKNLISQLLPRDQVVNSRYPDFLWTLLITSYKFLFLFPQNLLFLFALSAELKDYVEVFEG